MIISSAQNQRIKDVVKLRESKERRRRGVFSVEGSREVKRALDSGFKLVEIYFCSDVLADADELLKSDCEKIEVSSNIFKKLAVREESGGVVGIFESKTTELSELKLSETPFILAVEGVEKPGNLGALLRSADAAGVDALVVVDEKVDFFNPNVIRASLGTAFSVQVSSTNKDEFKEFCAEKKIKVLGAALAESAVSYVEADLKEAAAILLGTEAVGLSPYWHENCDGLVKIPMNGIADSLNVSAAGAVLVFEALRQREEKR